MCICVMIKQHDFSFQITNKCDTFKSFDTQGVFSFGQLFHKYVAMLCCVMLYIYNKDVC